MKKLALCVFAILAAISATAAAWQMDQQRMAEKMVRLHVVANSDTPEDQAMKLIVRDAVVAVTEKMEILELESALPEIERAALKTLRNNGCSDPVRVTLALERFPTRIYETFSLPAGVYRALRVTIGDGAGQNWWCVAFPSICFRATTAELEAAAVSAGFSEKEVALITEESAGYVFKFKTLELLAQLKNWLFDEK